MIKEEVFELEQKYIAHTYVRPPFVLEGGSHSTVYDTEGNAYLDMVAGIAVNALGYGDPEIVQTIQRQSALLIHVSNLYHTAPHVRLARKLCETSFADKVFFCNSGAEANEGALKFARKWARVNFGEGKTSVMAFTGAFHGRLFGSLALTPREKYQAPFRPLMPGVRFAEFNNLEDAREKAGDDLCAIFVEPIQGEGGIHPADPEFLRGLREIADQHNALLVFDEVQCGLGRTGYLWAHQGYGVEPDIMTVAKPIAGGLPMGAVLMTDRVASVIEPGDHGSTFAGGPLVSSVAEVVVGRISDPMFLAVVRKKGKFLENLLRDMQKSSSHVVDVRGKGLMWGIELDFEAKKVVEAGYERGLLTVNAGPNVLRLVPPLIVSEEELNRAVEIIYDIIENI